MTPQLSPTLSLCVELLKEASITPDDKNCQNILAERLGNMGFTHEFLYFGDPTDTADDAQVKNLWATHGHGSPVLCFLGHTDVVPVGDEMTWTHPPFSPTITDGKLYARGAADMKTAIACFTIACQNFLAKHPNHKGTIALLITSDEEGVAKNGTVKVVEHLQHQGKTIDYCLVGEPSSTHTLGDTIKNGRRGSLSGTLTITGKQGHVAYPHLAINPIHNALSALHEFTQTTWDNGNNHFPATSLQLSNIASGTGATNVIPQVLSAQFNFRFSTQSSANELKARTHAIFDKHFTNSQATYDIKWSLSGQPFLTDSGLLVDACCHAIQEVMGINPTLSTSGGTSDGRFVAPMGADVVELGVSNATIHQVDECVAVDELEKLTLIYENILQQLLT